MSKVYILTRGNYSDYHIIGVETDHKRAKRIQKMLTGDGYGDDVSIETWEVGDFGEGIDDLPTDRFLFNVFDTTSNWYFQGYPVHDGLRVEKTDSTSTNDQKVNTVEYWRRQFMGDDETYSVTVWAKDHAHAAKIAADLFAQYKAEQAGIT